jgi:hypothetical protein
VGIFSALPLLYAQDTLEAGLEIADASYEIAVPEATIVDESGISLDTVTTTELPTETSAIFVYVILAILCTIIGIIISFRIRNNTLKLF